MFAAGANAEEKREAGGSHSEECAFYFKGTEKPLVKEVM